MTDFVSQIGQDRWVVEYFKAKRDGFFLDIGAFDGLIFSNTYYLEKELGWKGLLIEPNPTEFAKLIKVRSNPAEQVCIVPKEEKVRFFLGGLWSGVDAPYTDDAAKKGTEVVEIDGFRLVTLLEKHKVPSVIDYMSLDIEGGEYEVLKDFPFDKYTVLAMTVEHNSYLGKKHLDKQEAMRKLLASHGYRLDREVQCDDFFVRP